MFAKKFLLALSGGEGVLLEILCHSLIVATKTWERRDVSAGKENACLVSFLFFLFFFLYGCFWPVGTTEMHCYSSEDKHLIQ